MFHIPFLVPEMYLNYDCDIRCSNLLEDFAKVLSKVSFLKSYHSYVLLSYVALHAKYCNGRKE